MKMTFFKNTFKRKSIRNEKEYVVTYMSCLMGYQYLGSVLTKPYNIPVWFRKMHLVWVSIHEIS